MQLCADHGPSCRGRHRDREDQHPPPLPPPGTVTFHIQHYFGTTYINCNLLGYNQGGPDRLKKSWICLEGKLMIPRQGNAIHFRSSQ